MQYITLLPFEQKVKTRSEEALRSLAPFDGTVQGAG